MARLFVAVHPPDAILAALDAALAGALGARPPARDPGRGPARVASRAPGHLTVRFLGEVADPPALGRALGEVRAQHPFPARLAGAGTFAAGRGRRVLWVGVGEGSAGLGELAARVDRACAGAGLGPRERPFRAHLTVARLPAAEASRVAVRLGAAPALGAAWTVEEVLLESSSFPAQPVRYTTVARLGLRGWSQ